jgi:hypothetical protein
MGYQPADLIWPTPRPAVRISPADTTKHITQKVTRPFLPFENDNAG